MKIGVLEQLTFKTNTLYSQSINAFHWSIHEYTTGSNNIELCVATSPNTKFNRNSFCSVKYITYGGGGMDCQKRSFLQLTVVNNMHPPRWWRKASDLSYYSKDTRFISLFPGVPQSLQDNTDRPTRNSWMQSKNTHNPPLSGLTRGKTESEKPVSFVRCPLLAYKLAQRCEFRKPNNKTRQCLNTK